MTVASNVVGIDLGGTYARAGIISADRQLLCAHETLIEARNGPQIGLQRIIHLIEQTIQESGLQKIDGIGIGATGPVDRRRGLVQNPYTLPTWENVPITAPIQERFGVPVVLENDADVAALGEYWAGAGQGVSSLYAVTVGTGIGTAAVIHGQILRGLDGAHPDGGHQIIDPSGPLCYCGAKGCWESLASGPAIAANARACLVEFPDSSLNRFAPGHLDQIDAQHVVKAARQADPLAIKVIERAAYHLALGIVNVVVLFTPEVIVLSGGVMKSADLFLPAIQKALAQHAVMVPADRVKITTAKLGYYAGLYGAAYSIFEELIHVQTK